MTARISSVTGVVLVGGKSRRMGRDKAFLKLDDKFLVERVVELFRVHFDHVVLAGDRQERFAGYGLDVLPDIYPGSALGGIYTALLAAETEYIFVSSCDLAFPNGGILRRLCAAREGFDAVVPSTAGTCQPLFALYRKTCLGPIKAQLEKGDCCAYAYFDTIKVRYVTEEELSELDPTRIAFMNINTPEDFRRAGGEL